MPRQSELRAIFHGYKLPNGQILREDFTVRIYLSFKKNRHYRYVPVIVPCVIGFGVDFAESKLHDAQAFVEKQFEKQVTDWA